MRYAPTGLLGRLVAFDLPSGHEPRADAQDARLLRAPLEGYVTVAQQEPRHRADARMGPETVQGRPRRPPWPRRPPRRASCRGTSAAPSAAPARPSRPPRRTPPRSATPAARRSGWCDERPAAAVGGRGHQVWRCGRARLGELALQRRLPRRPLVAEQEREVAGTGVVGRGNVSRCEPRGGRYGSAPAGSAARDRSPSARRRSRTSCIRRAARAWVITGPLPGHSRRLPFEGGAVRSSPRWRATSAHRSGDARP